MASPETVTSVTPKTKRWLCRLYMRTYQGRAKSVPLCLARRAACEKCFLRGRKDRATEIGLKQLIDQWPQFRGDEQNALWFQRTTDASNSRSELILEHGARFKGRRLGGKRAFEYVYQHQATLLEFTYDGLRALPLRRDCGGIQNIPCLTLKIRAGGVEKFIVALRRNSADKERVDMDGPKTGGPLQTLQAAREMWRVRELTAAVAGQKG